MMRSTLHAAACGLALLLLSTVAHAQEVNSLLVRIKAVGKEGANNIDVSKAWKDLVSRGPAVLPDILGGMDDANPIAVNWLRAAVESIQDRGLQSGQPMPKVKIESVLNDKSHSGRARRLAYECLVRLDPTTPDRLLPKMLDDPSSEIRRDAVARKLESGLKSSKSDSPEHKQFLQDLLRLARDRDQIDTIAGQLKKAGVEIDLTKHYGFVTRWLLIGPFDNTKGIGFNSIYPPEKGFEIKANYPGKGDMPVAWKSHETDKSLGLVDLNEAVGKLKGAVVYAYSAVESKSERPVEIRCGSNNAVRIWLNGKEVYFRDEYHHGFQMDQHVGRGVLKTGRNEILIKVCQNEQTDSWAQQWSFQLRVCDDLGGAIPIANVTEKVK